MIHCIYSNLPSFKKLEFKKGLNILLADQGLNSTERQTRNGTGKTSTIDLIHFLTGAKCDKKSIFKSEQLIESYYGMEFDIKGKRTIIERTGSKPSKVLIINSDTNEWPVSPYIDKTTGNRLVSNDNWKKVLGYCMFGLLENENDLTPEKYRPSFRSLFPYFVRQQNAGGFISPVQHFSKQQLWNIQVNISFLLGLDWTINQQWELVREHERTLKELKKAAGQGTFQEIIGTTADLRTKLAVAEVRVTRLKEHISNFKVLPEYFDLEDEASIITQQLGELSNQDIIDKNLIADLERSLHTESEPSFEELKDLYNEAGVIFPSDVIKRFEEVKAFHEAIIENRESYLREEIKDAELRISAREKHKEELSARREEIISILNSHGALEQLTKLQSELSRVEAEMEALRQRYIAAEQLESQKNELDIERGKLYVRLKQDFYEQSNLLREAILGFEEVSSQLYETAGSLIVSESTNGPKFEVKIERSRSKGINNMQIFCFDMMLMKLCTKRGIGPGFLIHDSHIFDGVDSRQVAKAIQIGAEQANANGFQYIITMNTDKLPKSYNKDFDIKDYVLPVRLTDATEDGGLFGLKFL